MSKAFATSKPMYQVIVNMKLDKPLSVDDSMIINKLIQKREFHYNWAISNNELEIQDALTLNQLEPLKIKTKSWLRWIGWNKEYEVDAVRCTGKSCPVFLTMNLQDKDRLIDDFIRISMLYYILKNDFVQGNILLINIQDMLKSEIIVNDGNIFAFYPDRQFKKANQSMNVFDIKRPQYYQPLKQHEQIERQKEINKAQEERRERERIERESRQQYNFYNQKKNSKKEQHQNQKRDSKREQNQKRDSKKGQQQNQKRDSKKHSKKHSKKFDRPRLHSGENRVQFKE